LQVKAFTGIAPALGFVCADVHPAKRKNAVMATDVFIKNLR